MDASIVTLSSGGQPLSKLSWTNESNSSFRYVPNSFVFTLDVVRWRQRCCSIDAVQLLLPARWVTDRPLLRPVDVATSTIEWTVTPCEEASEFAVPIRVLALEHGQEVARVERTLTVERVAVSQFDPRIHAIHRPNSVAGWGEIEPRRDIFERTFTLTVWPKRFFNGLYRAVVFLGDASEGYQGGICTGLARAALASSLSRTTSEPSLDKILWWHGRQLSDRALLAAAPWLIAPSPRRAFEAVKRDILRDGVVRRCYDIGVPKPWRADIFAALQKQGHTVVPFRIRQDSADRAFVTVYDPNDPGAAVAGTSEITFLLDRNGYVYPGVASAGDGRTTVIAVQQQAYLRGRTAILASLASIVSGAGGWAGAAWRSRRARSETVNRRIQTKR